MLGMPCLKEEATVPLLAVSGVVVDLRAGAVVDIPYRVKRLYVSP